MRSPSPRRPALAAACLLVWLAGCSEAGQMVSGISASTVPTASTMVTSTRVVAGGTRPTAAPGDGSSAATVSSVPGVGTSNTLEGAMALSAFYRDVLQAGPALADCYTAAAEAEGLHTVADLQAVEGDSARTARLSARFDACLTPSSGG